MSSAQEWKQEILSMSPDRKIRRDTKINIRDKRPSARHRHRSISKPSSSFSDFIRSLNNPYTSYIAVFCLFYLLGWWVIFSQIDQIEHDSKHKASSTLKQPSGDITHHLPRQIREQIQKLAHYESIHDARDHISGYIDKASDILKNLQNEIQSPSKSFPKKSKGRNVAVNILISKDPGIEGGFLDSAGALVMSIKEAQSVHNIHLIALVHKEVKYCLPILEAMGYEIRSYDTPFQIEDVKNKKIGEEMRTDGCCGILETLKLWAWTWTEFEVVLSIDADVHFHRNFDELFELNTTLGWTHGATADKNQELMNGGYLIIRPNVKHFEDMVEILKEGNFSGRGWRNSGIGWVYGGRTIQGIVPYYYLKVAVGDETEFERCKYNNMVEIEKCRNWTFSMVTSNHFTWCQKPWYCITSQKQPLCDDFRENWWKRSHKFEVEMLGFKEARPACKRRPYSFIQYYDSPYMIKYFKEHGYNTTKPEIPKEVLEKHKKKH